jgi:CheY-like chemotaxis protein
MMKDKQDQGLQGSLGERTVLVIDDSEAVRTALDVLLSMHGARVLGADSAAGGLDLLARESWTSSCRT